MRRIGSIAILACALSGCADYSGIHSESKPVAVKAASPKFNIDSKWWKIFRDDQLDTLIESALADSPDIKAAAARIRLADSLASLSRADLYPQINADGSAVRQRISANGYFPPPLGGSTLNLGQLALDFDYEFDWWGKNRAALHAALSERNAAKAEEEEARLILGAAIAQGYFRLQADLTKHDIAVHMLKREEALLDLLNLRAANGLESDLRVHEQASRVAESKLAISRLDESIKLGRSRIAALMGKPLDAGNGIVARIDLPPQIPSVIPADLIGKRPDIIAQRSRIEAASNLALVAKAEFYPNIDLGAYIGVQSIGFGSLLRRGSEINSFGPAIHLPIFGGGRLRANLRAQYAEYDILVEEYNKMVIDAMRDVHNASVSLESLTGQISAQNEAMAGLEKAHGIALLRYREGLDDELPVIESETPMLSQKAVRTDLDERRMETIIEMIKSLGGAPNTNPG